MIDKGMLREYTSALGIALDEAMLERFDLYARLLVEWNEKVNLTAITEPGEIVVKHFVDSLMLIPAAKLAPSVRLIDVGTGAGFPSVPVKIVRDDIELTLLDSLNKRLVFLTELSSALGQNNITIHERAEDAGRDPLYRERYMAATARAVANLRELAEYCLPFVEVGGIFAALKGGDCEQEVAEARAAINALGGELDEVKKFELPDKSGRSIIIIRKISRMSTNYPRTHAKMVKTPLV